MRTINKIAFFLHFLRIFLAYIINNAYFCIANKKNKPITPKSRKGTMKQ